MVKKAKKTSKKKVAVTKVVKVTAETKVATPVPSCIAELRAISAQITKMDVPDNVAKRCDSLAASIGKVAAKIYAGLDSEEKKAEREAKAKVRAEAKAARDAKKTAKKVDKIKKLKEQLAALEAPAADAK